MTPDPPPDGRRVLLDRRRFMQLVGAGTATAIGLQVPTLGEALASASVDEGGTFSLGVQGSGHSG